MFVLAVLCLGKLSAQEPPAPAAPAAPPPATPSDPAAPPPAAPSDPAAPAPATSTAPAPPPAGASGTPDTPPPPPDPAPAGPVVVHIPKFRIVDDVTAPRGWRVIDAEGAPVESVALATALGDEKVLRRLQSARTIAKVETGALIAVAAGLATGGVAEIVLAGPAIDVGDRPDPVAFQTWAEWREQADLWETRLARADQHDEKMWIGATLLTGAAFAGALIPITGRDAKARAEHPALIWDRAALERVLTPAVSVGPTSVSLSWVMR